MNTIAFVGKSGTGKSHRAIMVAKTNGADGIIDDGLLISSNKVIAGTSAKRESTKIASVKHALFLNPSHADEVKRAIKKYNLKSIMILGTSDKMVNQIASKLDLLPIKKIIRIEDVATPDEINKAQHMRLDEGKHIIPVPTFEIKKDFSGYFLHPLKNMQRSKILTMGDKSIVRPTFSYLGNYEISDNVLISITKYETSRIDGVAHVNSVFIRKTNHGAHIDISLVMKYGYPIHKIAVIIQKRIRECIETYTSVNARRVNIQVKGIV